MELNHIYTGDALKVLKSLPSESVDCIVTSPPYYCLRDYGMSGQIELEQSPEQYIKRLEKVFISPLKMFTAKIHKKTIQNH